MDSEWGRLVLIGALWGCTNALLRQEEQGQSGEASVGVAAHLMSLFRRPRFFVPFLVNQAGSVLFVVLLGSAELSLAVPICNATSFVFTLAVATLLGEKMHGDPVLLAVGSLCIVAGVTLMTLK